MKLDLNLKQIEISARNSDDTGISGERLLVTFYDSFVLFSYHEDEPTFSIRKDHLRMVIAHMDSEDAL